MNYVDGSSNKGGSPPFHLTGEISVLETKKIQKDWVAMNLSLTLNSVRFFCNNKNSDPKYTRLLLGLIEIIMYRRLELKVLISHTYL